MPATAAAIAPPRDVATANAAYLVAPDLRAALAVVNAVGAAMLRRHRAFIVVEVGELERDRLLTDDAPYLPPFEISVAHGDRPADRAALAAFVRAMEAVEVRYRSPQVEGHVWPRDAGWTEGLDPAIARLRVRFAPIYRQPGTERTYPDLRERVVAHIFDAILQAVAAFLAAP